MKKRRRTLELSVRYSPRINGRFVRMTEKIAERNHMPESDVLRYCFEAGLLQQGQRLKAKVERKAIDERALLDGMVTVRTTEWMGKKVEALFKSHQDVMPADILRGLLERMLPIARDKGMAAVMKIREMNL